LGLGRSFRISGRCAYHRWMRWEKKGAAIGEVRVGLRAPKLDDFCAICRLPRSLLEGVK
jgi:hypothetical protein